jgi:hypothetical protein
MAGKRQRMPGENVFVEISHAVRLGYVVKAAHDSVITQKSGLSPELKQQQCDLTEGGLGHFIRLNIAE